MIRKKVKHFQSYLPDNPLEGEKERNSTTGKLPNILLLNMNTFFGHEHIHNSNVINAGVKLNNVYMRSKTRTHMTCASKAKTTGLLVHIITWCNKFGTDPWVPFISSCKAPRTTRIHLEWQRLGSVSPSCNLWSGDHIYVSDLDKPNNSK